MAIALRAAATTAAINAAGTSITINVPTGTQDGDILELCMVSNNATGLTSLTGWTLIQNATTTGLSQATFYRVASSEPASYTFSGLTSARWSAVMRPFAGADQTTPLDVTVPAQTAGTTAQTYPAITPVTTGAFILTQGAVLETSNTEPTWTAGNMTAVDAHTAGIATGVSNAFQASARYGSWTSGAFTPTGSAATGTKTRSVGTTWALRPAGAASAAATATASITLSASGDTGATAPAGSAALTLSASGTGTMPGLTYSDDYNRGTGLGANWVTNGTAPVSISGNQVIAGTAASAARWSGGSIAAGVLVSQMTWPGGNGGGVAVAMPAFTSGSSYNIPTYYVFRELSGGTFIAQKDASAGTHTILATIGSDWTAGDVVRLEYDGTTLTAYRNGVIVGTATPSSPIDPTVQNGVGIVGSIGNAASAVADNWAGGSYPLPGASATGSASISLTASGVGTAPIAGTASLSVTASGGAGSPSTGSGSIALAASGVAAVATSGTASVALTATGASASSTTGSATLSITGSGASQAATTGTGTVTLAASGAGTAVASGAASLTVSATGTGTATAVTGAAALSVSASGTARASAAGAGSISVSATGGSSGQVVGSAAISVTGSGTARSATTGAGSITFAGTGSWFTGGTAALSVSGVGSTSAAATGTSGAISVSAAGTASAALAGSASLSLSASGADRAAVTGAGSVTLSASGASATASTATASITLSATGIAGTQSAATGSAAITVTGSGTARAAASGAGSITLSASGAGTTSVTGTGAIAVTATGAPSSKITGSASLSVTGTGSTSATALGSAALTVSATGSDTGVAAGSATLTITGSGTTPPVAVTGAAALTLTASGASSATARSTTASITLVARNVQEPGTWNYAANPSFETSGTTNFSASNGTRVQSSVWSEQGTFSSKVTVVAANVTSYLYIQSDRGQVGRTPIEVGQYASVRVRVRAIKDIVVRMNIAWYRNGTTSGATTSSGSDVTILAGQEATIERLNVVAPAQGTYDGWLPILYYNDAGKVPTGSTISGAGEDYLYVDGWVLISSHAAADVTSPIPYFDGGTQGYTWLSTAGTSASAAIGHVAGVAVGTASITLTGSATTQAPVAGAASLTLTASGSASSPPVVGAASLTLSAAGTARAAGSANAALTVSASGTAGARTTGSASIAVTGSTTARGTGTASAAISLVAGGVATPRAIGTASVSLSASGGGAARVGGSASFEVVATAQLAAAANAQALITLGATGAAHRIPRDINIRASVDPSRFAVTISQPALGVSIDPSPMSAELEGSGHSAWVEQRWKATL